MIQFQDINVELKDYGRLRKDSELKIQSHDNPNKTKVKITDL